MSSTAPSHSIDLAFAPVPGAACPARSPAGITEPAVTICRPLIVLGDLARVRSEELESHAAVPEAPFRFVSRDGDIHWCLSTDDWRITSPVLPTNGVSCAASSEAVLDVYVALLAAFAQNGLPTDNTVRFAPGPFTREMGWTAGAARGAPTGRHYRQLELALDHLRHANIESEAVRAQLEAVYGMRLLRANFSVLQSWSKAAVAVGVGNSVQMEARFSDHFAALLRHDRGVVSYCAAQYGHLPRGVPRALYRYIEGVRAAAASPLVTVAASTVLAHIGSRRRDLEPSRMKEILDEPHHVLCANGVLGDLPEWSESDRGEWQLTYMLESTPDLAPLLEETAEALGVNPTLAHCWATNRLDRFTAVFAAAIQGIFTPTGTIGTMFNFYMEVKKDDPIAPAALPHFEEGVGLLQPRQRCPEFEFLQEQHLATRTWLTERPAVEKALRRKFATEARPGWVTDGLVLIAARRLRRAENLKVWRHRVYGATRLRRR